MAKANKSEKVPQTMQTIYAEIVALTNDFSQKYLNDEYAQLIRYAAAALCRKKPSPLSSGKIQSWACGITYAMGFVNFLFDKSQQPSIRATDLCAAFGVSQSTGAAKAKVVKDALKLVQLDPEWCLPSKLENNLMAWLIMVNGVIVDVRAMPRDVQEIAYQKGLIPHLPAEAAE